MPVIAGENVERKWVEVEKQHEKELEHLRARAYLSEVIDRQGDCLSLVIGYGKISTKISVIFDYCEGGIKKSHQVVEILEAALSNTFHQTYHLSIYCGCYLRLKVKGLKNYYSRSLASFSYLYFEKLPAGSKEVKQCSFTVAQCHIEVGVMNTSISRTCHIVYHQCLHNSTLKKSLPAAIYPVLFKAFSTNRKMSSKLDNIAKRLAGTEKNVWVEFSGLVREHKAINLGQGFPDFMPPSYLAEELRNVTNSDNPLVWQYSRSFGHPRLVNAVAECYGKVMNRKIDPNTEVLISNGAYGCLFATIQGLINPGEEVIIIEPYFDCYEPQVRVAGGKPVFIPLQPTKKGVQISSNDWKLDPEELASKFNSNTKAIILNTPNNPLGKVFNMEEIQMVADLCIKHDVMCIADEVYEWMVYDDSKHIKIATLPGMWERTVTVGSAGKTFSSTGLKLGWAIAPQRLMRGLQIQHQNSLYLLPTPTQEAVACCFEREIPRMDKPECYFNSISEELKPKRDNLARMLTELGMMPTIPDGGYFMIADISNFAELDLPLDDTDDPFDFKFVRWMTKEKKLSAIPPSAFYSKEHKHLADKFIRFCFIKNDSTLEQAAGILKKWKDSL